MKVFLCTNVLASALATRGLCSDVLREVLEFHNLIVSPPLFEELDRTLGRKFKVPRGLVDEALSMLSAGSHVSESVAEVSAGINDTDDLVILGSAVSGGAEVFVTGDKEVLGVRNVGGMRVLSPRQFWDSLRR